MASGHALAKHRRTGKRVQIIDINGRPRWSDVWRGLDWMAQPHERGDEITQLRNGPGCRPYIEYPFNRQRGLRFSGWRARDHVGALRLSGGEVEFAWRLTYGLGPFTVIEPHLTPKSNPNKQWGKWKELVPLLPGQVVQLGPVGTETLPGVLHLQTPTFRMAAAVLTFASGLVLPEGGLHHAAGVLRLPAVVLYGGTVDVQATGYEWHTNIVDNEPGSPCGTWLPCHHCRNIWKRLTPEAVAAAAENLARKAA